MTFSELSIDPYDALDQFALLPTSRVVFDVVHRDYRKGLKKRQKRLIVAPELEPSPEEKFRAGLQVCWDYLKEHPSVLARINHSRCEPRRLTGKFQGCGFGCVAFRSW